MDWGSLFIITGVIAVAIFGAFYFLNRWSSRKMVEQEEAIERTKQTVSIYVIDKKKLRPSKANFPKAVTEQIPRYAKLMKMPLVKAKIGPQILTLMCDKNVFEALPLKKNVAVEIAGIYIVNMKGMKSAKEMKALAQAKKGGDGRPFWKKLIGIK